MRFPGFIGGSYTLQSVSVDAQRCINYYPEIDEMQTGKEGEVASLVSTPGLRLLCTLPTGPVRGVYTAANDQLFAVAGNVLYYISPNFQATVLGPLVSNSGSVMFSDNGVQMVIADGPYGYKVTLQESWGAISSDFTQINDPNFLGATQVAFMDGYLIFNQPNTQNFYLSPLEAVTPLSGLDIGAADGSTENLVGIAVLSENLYLFCERHFEVWYDSGNENFPFLRQQGAVMKFGCAAAFSIAVIQNMIFFLGRDDLGQGIVYQMQGLSLPQRVSTFAIESVMEGLGDLSTARAYAYQQGGHAFYCLNLPGAQSTWCFDATTGFWHERAYLAGGVYQRSLPDCHAFAYQTNVVGDYSSGNLYALDRTVFSDDGNPLVRERRAPHLAKDMARLFHASFQLDMETGVGLDGGVQGSAPQAILQWSNDGGHTWSNEHWAAIGPIGARKTRVIWRRLGQARDRVYRVRIADPVKATLIGAEIDVLGGDA